MDQMFDDLGLDFSSIESTITDSIDLDDSYCDIKNMTAKIDEVKNQITGTAENPSKIVNFQDLAKTVSDNIGDGDKLKTAVKEYTDNKQNEFNDTTKLGVKTILSVYLNAYIELMLLNGTDVSG